MSSDLPEIGGIKPVGVVTKVKGTGQRIERALDLGQRVVLLVEARISDACQLKDTKEGPKLHQGLSIDDLWVLDEHEARDLLREKRAQHNAATDKKKGLTPFHVDDTVQAAGIVNGSGVVMTASELAEARGIDLDPDGDIVCVVFADGSKGFWPDDWKGSGQTLALPGGFMRAPKGAPGETAQVVGIEDVDTGEPIGPVWTAADEEARLLAEEEAALAAEAEADRAVVDELEGGRVSVTEVLGRNAKAINVEVLTGGHDSAWLLELLDAEVAGKARKGVVQTINLRLAELEAAS